MLNDEENTINWFISERRLPGQRSKEILCSFMYVVLLVTVVIGILIVRFWLQIPPILEHGFLFESEFVIWKWVVGISSFSFLIHQKFVC